MTLYYKGYCDAVIYILPRIKKSFQFCSVQCSEGYVIKKKESILASYDNLPILFEIILKKKKSALEPPVWQQLQSKKGVGGGNGGNHQ